MSYNKSRNNNSYDCAETDFSQFSNYDIYEEFVENNYCFDPTWKELTKEELENLKIHTVDLPSEYDNVQTQEKSSDLPAKRAKNESIHKGHRDRVREKFFKFGLECFSEFEVLEFLLFFSISRKDTNELAHKLIDKFGSLKGVLSAEYYDLMEVDGISEVSASLITLQREISKYLHTSNKVGERLTTAKKAGAFCCDYFSSHVEENAILLILDPFNTVLAIEVISKGSETETALYSRKIVKSAVKHRGSKVMLAHNHPNSDPTPSSNDIYNTGRIGPALREFGIDLVDHIVCGGKSFVSMSNSNMLKF